MDPSSQDSPERAFPEHPDDITSDGESRVVRNYYACQSHCCLRHHCKYGYTGCPVTTGQVTQDHPCEECTQTLWDHGVVPATGEVEYTLVLSAMRDRALTSESPMTGMPTSEQVAASVANALRGLDLGNGWSLNLILDPETGDPR